MISVCCSTHAEDITEYVLLLFDFSGLVPVVSDVIHAISVGIKQFCICYSKQSCTKQLGVLSKCSVIKTWAYGCEYLADVNTLFKMNTDGIISVLKAYRIVTNH